MKFSLYFFNKHKKFLLIILCLFLLVFIFKWIDYLVINKFIIECFTNTNNINWNGIGGVSEKYDGTTSHSVDLPINTLYSCKNFCNPQSRCALTKEQCSTDIDCPGCQPNLPKNFKDKENKIQPNNDAGKMTTGFVPQYSTLTSGYGTSNGFLYKKDINSRAPQANFGVNIWTDMYNQGLKLFKKRYEPKNLQYMPQYKPIYSMSGEYLGDGPLPANY